MKRSLEKGGRFFLSNIPRKATVYFVILDIGIAHRRGKEKSAQAVKTAKIAPKDNKTRAPTSVCKKNRNNS